MAGDRASRAAARFGRLAALELLLACGANPRESGGPESPLALAAAAGSSPCAKALLAAGARVEGEPGDGAPLALAASRGDARAVDILLALGAHPEGADASGRRALALAARSGGSLCVQLLLSAGADARGPGGALAARAAAGSGSAESMGLLMGAGADFEAPGDGGVSAAQAAFVAGHGASYSKPRPPNWGLGSSLPLARRRGRGFEGRAAPPRGVQGAPKKRRLALTPSRMGHSLGVSARGAPATQSPKRPMEPMSEPVDYMLIPAVRALLAQAPLYAKREATALRLPRFGEVGSLLPTYRRDESDPRGYSQESATRVMPGMAIARNSHLPLALDEGGAPVLNEWPISRETVERNYGPQAWASLTTGFQEFKKAARFRAVELGPELLAALGAPPEGPLWIALDASGKSMRALPGDFLTDDGHSVAKANMLDYARVDEAPSAQ